MRTVIQRVQHCSVTIDGQLKSNIGSGMLVLVGIEDRDTQEDIEWLCKKIANLRIFDDENGVMNRSVIDTGGEVMVANSLYMPLQRRETAPPTSMPPNRTLPSRCMNHSVPKWDCKSARMSPPEYLAQI